MPTLINWITQRSGAGLRITGTEVTPQGKQTRKITGATGVVVTRDGIFAVRGSTRIAQLDHSHLTA